MGDGYYASRKTKLLKDFDKAVKQVKGVLISRYGKDLTDIAVNEARLEYENLIPQIPYIGGKQPFTRFIIATASFLAIYKVLKAHGKSVDEAGRIIYEATERIIYSYPWFIRCLIGKVFFSKILLSRLRKGAAESQKRLYPPNYVYTFVEGDGKEFDFGVDYTECAPCKFLNLHGAPELAPYICLCDEVNSEAFGWGLVRTTTIAEGSEKCDFRFKKGGRTRILSRISRSGWSKRLR
jgi:hypothetical protein